MTEYQSHRTIEDLKSWEHNPRKISDEQREFLHNGLEEFGDLGCIVYNRQLDCLVGGHQRVSTLPKEARLTIEKVHESPTRTGEVAVGFVEWHGERFKYREVDWNADRHAQAAIIANKAGGEWNFTKLREVVLQLDHNNADLKLTGFNDIELENLMTYVPADDAPVGGMGGGEREEAGEDAPPTQNLSERFLMPPFSVLDARKGNWQARKKQWLSLGIKSEIGRGENVLDMSAAMAGITDPIEIEKWNQARRTGKGLLNPGKTREWGEYKGGNACSGSGTSIFDPVLCELSYLWFSPKQGSVLDPFAGGSVRGVVASLLGREYVGCELREEQVKANREQAEKICSALEKKPVWYDGDSRRTLTAVEPESFDMVFSCPPYADLEVYSNDPADLSNMEFPAFLEAYRDIIAKSISALRQDRFAAFVVGEVREKTAEGFYRRFIAETIMAFEAAGARFYNEMILVTSVGTLALRAAKPFLFSRKVGKTHQNLLIFCKGDPRKAAEACGSVDILEMAEEAPSEELSDSSAEAQ